MTVHEFKFIGANGMMLPGVIYAPICTPTLVVEVIHGMTDHMGRYKQLAEYLTDYGIAVAGFDLRGHGQNPGDPQCASLGKGGWERSLHDMHLFHQELKSRYPKAPHFMLGFSLGSFLLRDYLGRYHDKIDGAIIMGTGHQPGFILNMLMPVVGYEILTHGFDSSTQKIRELSFESYNKRFGPNLTSVDWLCSDTTQRALYLGDPLCRKTISAGLFWQLLDAMKRTGRQTSYRTWNKDIPILLLSGEDDPVGDYGKGVRRVKKAMDRAGVKHIQMYLIPRARHDLFHEEKNGGSEAAFDTLTNWLFENT